MVQDLLTISRLDAPGFVYNKSSLNISKLINECLVACEDLFIQKELIVEKSISPDSPKGNRVCVKTWEEAGKVKLTIENTGVHIPDNAIPKLFEVLYRIIQNQQTGSTGLGLYIVKTILDLHGAEIRVANMLQGVIISILF